MTSLSQEALIYERGMEQAGPEVCLAVNCSGSIFRELPREPVSSTFLLVLHLQFTFIITSFQEGICEPFILDTNDQQPFQGEN